MPKTLPLVLAALMLAAIPARADGGRSIVGRCFAAVDGKTQVDSPCQIKLEVGGGFAFQPVIDTFRVVPSAATGTGTATWSRYDDVSGKEITRTLGPLTRRGACWTDAQTRICAWDGTADARKNRDAPYTDFRPLVGKDVQGRCHMGECQYFRFDRATMIDHRAREALFEIEARTWVVDHPDADYKRPGKRSGEAGSKLYMRCSKTRPAIMWREKGAWTLYAFAPGSEAGVSGASEFVNAEYAAACHASPEGLSTPAGVLLGYPTDAAPSAGDGETIAKPEAALH